MENAGCKSNTILDNTDGNICDLLPKLSIDEKYKLAGEIREKLISTVLKNGGHLASNLGVVELTIGMYSVLDPFTDKIIWDVGHQSYVHKLLTSRTKDFDTIRLKDGLSGFPLRDESKSDVFDTGHSSTSISAAIGFARARDLNNEQYSVCAVIGDGAFGSGMAFEAINDGGRATNDCIVILNDNEMAISKGVGGLSKYLRKIRSRKSYLRFKKDAKTFIPKIPLIGKHLYNFLNKIKSSIRVMVIPGEAFEQLGWKYLGPIDGHDINAVSLAIEKARLIGGPVLIHVITKKGKGYKPAEENPTIYHGVSPKDSGSLPSFSKAVAHEISSIADSDRKIVVINAAMTCGTGFECFEEKFKDRYFDVGIAEQHAVTMASAIALSGYKPYVAMYSTFLQRAYDQVLHDVCLQNANVTFLIDRAGLTGFDGKTHQGIFDISYLKSMPNMTILAPASISDAREMIAFANSHDGPIAIRYPAKEKNDLSFDSAIEIGKGVIAYNSITNCQNKKVLILSLGSCVSNAIEASKLLNSDNVETIVYNLRFAKPIDFKPIFDLISKYHFDLITSAEDGAILGGVGETIANKLISNNISIKMHSFGVSDTIVKHASISQQQSEFGISAQCIANTITKLLYNK